MLALTLHQGNRIVLRTSDGDIVVRLGRRAATTVPLTFEAPQAVRILRGEVIEREAEAAAEIVRQQTDPNPR